MAKPTNQETIVDLSDEQDTPPIASESTTQAPTPTGIKTYTELARGRKKCPSCSLIVGAKQAVCSCGHVFIKGETKVAPTHPRGPRTTQAPAKIDPLAIWKVIRSRGFELSCQIDALDDSAEPKITAEKEIQPLVDFIQSESVDILSTTPSIKFSLGLDDVMKLLKIRDRK